MDLVNAVDLSLDWHDAVHAKRVLSEIRQGKRKVYNFKKQFEKITSAKP